MAYQTPPTKAPDDLWTADEHNTYIRDNFEDHEARIAGLEDVVTQTAYGETVIDTSPGVIDITWPQAFSQLYAWSWGQITRGNKHIKAVYMDEYAGDPAVNPRFIIERDGDTSVVGISFIAIGKV